MDMLLEVENLKKSFGGVQAVDDLSFVVQEGSITGLIGPNGSGKTTCFNLISGLLRPDAGSIRFAGREITSLRPSWIARLGIGRSFQIPAPFTRMTVLENVMVGAFSRTRSLGEASRLALEVLEFTGLKEKRDELAANLTTADRKRLEVARALSTGPRLLLLDEVIAGLNPTEVLGAMELIRAIRARGITVFMVEHVMEAVLPLCEWVIVLNFGRKIVEDTPDRIVRNPAVIEAYLGERFRARS